jgi:Transposase and inactivated derivatives
VLLADRGFADGKLMKYLKQNLGWHFRIRIRGRFKSPSGGKKLTQYKLQIETHSTERANKSKAYPSNLSRAQYEFLSEFFPDAKPGGRPRTTDLWEVLNAILYVLVEGCRWHSLPADFPAWQTVYT